MNTAWLIAAVVVVVLALTALGIVVGRLRRRRDLRERFGPEYDRAVSASGSPRQAETDLRRRLAERHRIPLRALSAAQKDRYEQDWRQVQADFVDVPDISLARADMLVTDVMIDCGYPMRDFEQRVDLVSVDHPLVVEHYRLAHGIFVRSQLTQVSTEDIRRAFVSYRALFTELMGNSNNPVEQLPSDRSPTASF